MLGRAADHTVQIHGGMGLMEEVPVQRLNVEDLPEPPDAAFLAVPREAAVDTVARLAAMTLGSGGVLTELVADAVTILLPADRADLEEALGRLRVSRQLDGFRGAARADRSVIVEALHRFAAHVCQEGGGLVEIDVNPLFVLPDRVCAVDALMRARGE